MSKLARWYAQHGRHELAWRATNDRWAVLVSEVMLAQTQVQRVAIAWPEFMQRFPDVHAAAVATPADLLETWGRLGYPRRARRLWETARIVDGAGWPDDYQQLPGVGPYTAGALAAQADGELTAIGIDVNIRRVVQRVRGAPLNDRDARAAAIAIARPLVGRDRLLALMDLGALVCTARQPGCFDCPLHTCCATRGQLVNESRSRQAPYAGSLRQRRGDILALLRTAGRASVDGLDEHALTSLLADQLIAVAAGTVTLARE